MENILTADGLISLATLTALELVLGIDNIVFIAILVAKLPKGLQDRARKLGLSLALILRLGLLFSISWLMSLTEPMFHVWSKGISGRDLILLVGGGFLIAKATFEIHEKLEHQEEAKTGSQSPKSSKSFWAVISQILLIDIVFSLDSVITAVGMAQHLEIMVIAMVASMVVMLMVAGAISNFIHRHPTLKMLALSFLILIGVMLLMEGMGNHVEKGYIYFAMAFSLVVEMLNIKYRSKQTKK